MNQICSICLESYFVDSYIHNKRKFVTICNHVFHYDCIHFWAEQNNSCPVCRTDNLIYEFITTNDNYDNYDNNDNNDIDNIISNCILNEINFTEFKQKLVIDIANFFNISFISFT